MQYRGCTGRRLLCFSSLPSPGQALAAGGHCLLVGGERGRGSAPSSALWNGLEINHPLTPSPANKRGRVEPCGMDAVLQDYLRARTASSWAWVCVWPVRSSGHGAASASPTGPLWVIQHLQIGLVASFCVVGFCVDNANAAAEMLRSEMPAETQKPAAGASVWF